MGLFSSKPNVGAGDESTEGLPRRINKAERHAAQAAAARRERAKPSGFSVGGGDRVRADGVQVKGADPNDPAGWTPSR